VELLAQRPHQVLDGLPLPDQLPAGLLPGAGQRPRGQPLEGGQQQLLVAAGQQPAEQQPTRQPEGEPGQQAEQEGGGHRHAGTVAPASDRTAGHAAPVPSYGVSLSLGIVGLPNVGKSTLFNALTKNDVLAANYPFATIEPNVGVVGVPDARLPKLAELFGSAKTIPATVDFVDIAGIVKGASEGEGLGNKFLANIRDSDAICQVIRVFQDDNVVHVDGRVSPKDDMDTINTELILADLQTVEKVIPRLEKEARIKKDVVPQLEAVRQAQEVLDSGRTVFAAGLDRGPLRELHLLTAKPFLYVFNLDENELVDTALRAELSALVAPAEAVFLDAKVEMELIEMDEADALELLQSMGQSESGCTSWPGSASTPSACRPT
jgi:GTP-binding protein YchF